MKMYYGNVPVSSMKVGTNTDDATFVASDLQAGKTGYSMGRKVTGTGKSFEFANYGSIDTNLPLTIPSAINVVEIASTIYPLKSAISFSEIVNVDFTTPQTLGYIFIDDIEYPITITANNGMFILSCDKATKLQFFYGKDNYLL